MKASLATTRKLDQILLHYPPILYLAAVAYLWAINPEWGRDQIVTSLFVTFILLGNFAHNFLSFWQIARIPEFKEWARTYRFKNLNIWQITGITYACLLLIVIYLTPNGFNTFSNKIDLSTLTGWVVFILIGINTHHNVAQMKGLCISLSYKGNAPLNTADLQSLTKKEKLFHNLLVLDWLVFMLWALYFNAWIDRSFLIVRTFWLTGLAIYVITIYKNVPSEMRFQKLIYNTRHLYRFFFAVHPIIPFLAFGIHGADAILIYWKACLKTKADSIKTRLSSEFLILFVLFGAIFYIIKHYKLDHQPWHQAVVAVFLTHYIVEGFMYRMQNPLTKKHIAPLL